MYNGNTRAQNWDGDSLKKQYALSFTLVKRQRPSRGDGPAFSSEYDQLSHGRLPSPILILVFEVHRFFVEMDPCSLESGVLLYVNGAAPCKEQITS